MEDDDSDDDVVTPAQVEDARRRHIERRRASTTTVVSLPAPPLVSYEWMKEMAAAFAHYGCKDEPNIGRCQKWFEIQFTGQYIYRKGKSTIEDAIKHRDDKASEFGIEEMIANNRIQKRLKYGTGTQRERFQSAIDVLSARFPVAYESVIIDEQSLPTTTEFGIAWNKRQFQWWVRIGDSIRQKYLWQFADAISIRDEMRDVIIKKRKKRNDAMRESDPAYKNVPYAATNADATEEGVKYWSENNKDDFMPMLVLNGPNEFRAACRHPTCNTGAYDDGRHGGRIHCVKHGGGRRCEMEFCLPDEKTGFMPFGLHVVEGNWACSDCYALHAMNKTKGDRCVTKDQLVAIYNELAFPHLDRKAIGGTTCDATLGIGKSKRRTDQAWRIVDDDGCEFQVVNEADEGTHQSGRGCYTLDGQSGKFSGHMSDLGAPAMTERDATFMETTSLDDIEREEHLANRARDIADKVLAKEAKMVPLRIVSFQVDEYTDKFGVKHPPAFQHYQILTGPMGNQTSQKRIRVRQPEWDKRYARNKLELEKMFKLGASGRSFEHVHLFYDGCDPVTGLGGRPPKGKADTSSSAAAAHDAIVAVSKKRAGKRKMGEH